jgi:hypothetical protein
MALTFEQLLPLREQTDTIAQFLQRRLHAHLEALRPLLTPRRLLGKYVGGQEEVAGAGGIVTRLREQYKQLCGKPFSLVPELDVDVFSQMEHRLELYPWEYTHTAKDPKEGKAVTITSPVRWVLAYRSGYTLAELRRSLTGTEARRPDALRQFLVNVLVMRLMFESYPSIAELLGDLRYEVSLSGSPDLGDLELVTVSAGLPSFRPADDLILMATRYSGVPAFIELLDVDAVRHLPDPFRMHIEELLSSSESTRS